MLVLFTWSPVAFAQPPLPVAQGASGGLNAAPDEPSYGNWEAQRQSLLRAVIRLPVATGLSAVLAFRPRRRGTPARQVAVIQTQIILAIVGAIVMLVVGASLARAFGIVGAAGLIRYRAKIDDPKDAGVMLSTLALGLASGVGLYALAAFGMVFVLGVLWVLESIEPEPYNVFQLTVSMKEANDMRTKVEQTFRRFRIPYELRGSSQEELSFEVRVPAKRNTEHVSTAIAAIDPERPIEVKWDKKKDK
jgi:hypothetical protein